jgi:uncharacterized protein YndB with AHSA1/START domain
MRISVEIEINAPLNEVWQAWINPQDISRWNFANDDWCCPSATIELRVGGTFNYRMEAKDGSMGFNFEGEFTGVVPMKSIAYKLADDRKVLVDFIEGASCIKVIETFDIEDENSAEQQRSGWLCILNNFKKFVESTKVNHR